MQVLGLVSMREGHTDHGSFKLIFKFQEGRGLFVCGGAQNESGKGNCLAMRQLRQK